MTEKSDLLRRAQLAAMFGGFLMLLTEIRFEHRAVLIDDWCPWIPLGICAAMLVLIPLAEALWKRGGRTILKVAYGLTIAVGMLGLYFHSEGHLLQRLSDLALVMTNLDAGASLNAAYPPLLAPCSFIGLGIVGWLQL
jgi:hypothetical protein